MSAMTASTAAARVAASTRTNGSAKSSRVVKTNAVAQRNGIAQSSAFFQGDRSTAVELRQRAVTSPVSRRHISKRQVAAGASVPAPVVQAAAPADWKGTFWVTAHPVPLQVLSKWVVYASAQLCVPLSHRFLHFKIDRSTDPRPRAYIRSPFSDSSTFFRRKVETTGLLGARRHDHLVHPRACGCHRPGLAPPRRVCRHHRRHHHQRASPPANHHRKLCC